MSIHKLKNCRRIFVRAITTRRFFSQGKCEKKRNIHFNLCLNFFVTSLWSGVVLKCWPANVKWAMYTIFFLEFPMIFLTTLKNLSPLRIRCSVNFPLKSYLELLTAILKKGNWCFLLCNVKNDCHGHRQQSFSEPVATFLVVNCNVACS